MKSKRFLCLLLVLLMVFSLTPSETRAETTVYFTAVNDQLLPDLSDETMPFWSATVPAAKLNVSALPCR